MFKFKFKTKNTVKKYVQKKEPLLNGSLNFTGTEALRANMKFACLSATYVNSYILNVNQPAAPCMAVRVANGIPRCGSTTAAITEL